MWIRGVRRGPTLKQNPARPTLKQNTEPSWLTVSRHQAKPYIQIPSMPERNVLKGKKVKVCYLADALIQSDLQRQPVSSISGGLPIGETQPPGYSRNREKGTCLLDLSYCLFCNISTYI